MSAKGYVVRGQGEDGGKVERIIPGLVCAECDRHIYMGEQYAGKGGHAAHWSCRVWPVGTEFKVAGGAPRSVE